MAYTGILIEDERWLPYVLSVNLVLGIVQSQSVDFRDVFHQMAIYC
jgi:hypothetical protein